MAAVTDTGYQEVPNDGDATGKLSLQKVRPQSAADLRPLVDNEANGSDLARHKRSLLAPLTLRQEVVLDSTISRIGYHIVHMTIRCLPFLVIYGGTSALILCVALRYRWGVLMSMMLYTAFMLLSSLEMTCFGAWGILLCWINSRNDWFAMYLKEHTLDDKSPKYRRAADPFNVGGTGDLSPSGSESIVTPCSSAAWAQGGPRDMVWNDVFHVLMVPTYKTPIDCLRMAMAAAQLFTSARTHLGICFAFEERESGCQEKADMLKREYSSCFAFVTAAFHPPNLPNHVPGKSSNECWAFSEMAKEFKRERGWEADDPRIVITVIDDDSELHENYFEALTYHFLKATESQRYLTIWQPPILHFKNFLTQPLLVRTASLFTTLHELACLANPIDCHVPFSSYSISLMMASAVGGWDPDYISEDWHMFAKCALMTEGRARCKPIFLPLLNYAPEEETCWGTVTSRWTQATRHALGVSEVVYVVTGMYVGMLELGSPWRSILFIYRMLPVLGKFISVHFVVSTLAFWPLLSHILINVYMWHSWCYIEDLQDTCASCCVPMATASEFGIGQERVVLNSWMVYFQERANAGVFFALVLAGGWGAFYFHLVKDRVDGDYAQDWVVANPILLWGRTMIEIMTVGWFSSLAFGSVPEWIAVVRIMGTMRFHHVVAGMVGRTDDDDDPERDGNL